MERERGEWLTAQLYRLQLEGPDSLQQHLDFWGETSMTEGRERKGNEADEYNRGQGRYCYLLSALDPWKHPHLRVFSLGCEHAKPPALSPNLPPLCHQLFLQHFFFFFKTLPTTARHPECSPKTRSDRDTKNLSYSATVWKTRVSITFTKVNK